MVSSEDILKAASLRWRSPEQPPLRFDPGDRVIIARIGDGMTTRELIGHVGVLENFLDDDLPGGTFAWSELAVDVRCNTCGGTHTMSQHELDLLGSDDSLDVQEKADYARPDAPVVELDTRLVLAMHEAGFVRLAVDDKPKPAGDPAVVRPAWSKHVYGIGTELMDLTVYQERLMAVARTCGGALVEWHLMGRGERSYNSLVTPDRLHTCMVSVPFRALIEARSTL